MVNTLRVLYNHWADSGAVTKAVKKSWKKIDKQIFGTISEEQQGTYFKMLVDYYDKVQYQGFAAGFQAATKLWENIK